MRVHVLKAIAGGVVIGVTSAADASVLNPGSLVAIQLGDGSTTLSTAAAQVNLREFNPVTGSAIQTVTLDTNTFTQAGAGTGSGGGTSESRLTYNEGYLALAGYVAPAGTASVVSTATTSVLRRVVGINAAVDLATGAASPQLDATTTSFNSANIRDAVVLGGNFYAIGSATASPGPVYIPNGNAGTLGTSINVSGSGAGQIPSSSTRGIEVYQGALYFTTHATSRGVYTTAISTSEGTPASIFVATPAASNNSTAVGLGDFWLDINDAPSAENPSIAYVTDEGASATNIAQAGVKKYTNDGTGWALQYTISTDYDNLPLLTGTGVDGPATTGARYMAVDDSGAVPVIYVTSVDGTRILKLTDLGTKALSDGSLQTLAVAEGTNLYKGLALIPVPEPTSAALLLGGGGTLLLMRRRRSCGR